MIYTTNAFFRFSLFRSPSSLPFLIKKKRYIHNYIYRKRQCLARLNVDIHTKAFFLYVWFLVSFIFHCFLLLFHLSAQKLSIQYNKPPSWATRLRKYFQLFTCNHLLTFFSARFVDDTIANHQPASAFKYDQNTLVPKQINNWKNGSHKIPSQEYSRRVRTSFLSNLNSLPTTQTQKSENNFEKHTAYSQRE